MATTTIKLAKLSRPRLHAPLLRSRLFARLDDSRRHPVVWLSGPPGAGKTTLIGSYLDSAKVPAVWCQLDAGDADPATFFYYLGLAPTRRLGRQRRGALPLLRPEYLTDLSGFAIAGIVLGALALVMFVIGLIVMFSYPQWLQNLPNAFQP